jgi:hypothetical protein
MTLIFPSIGNVIIPTDELIFFRGVGLPPTSYKIIIESASNQHRPSQQVELLVKEALEREIWTLRCAESRSLPESHWAVKMTARKRPIL